MGNRIAIKLITMYFVLFTYLMSEFFKSVSYKTGRGEEKSPESAEGVWT